VNFAEAWNWVTKKVKKDDLGLDPEKTRQFQDSFRRATHKKSKKKKTKKSQPTSSQVHVPAINPLEVIKSLSPGKTAGQLHDEILSQHDNIGGTIRDGSDDERFVFGPMVFDIGELKGKIGANANGTAEVSPDWSHKINVNPEHAMRSTSDRPVYIASIPTTNGIEHLLIDGHHRMHKALHDGDKEVPAYILSPEETIDAMDTHPDLMQKMRENLESLDTDPSMYENTDKNVKKGMRVAKVAIVCGPRLLMLKRKDSKKWELPGGMVAPQETMKEAAIREVMEETGIELDPRFVFPIGPENNVKGVGNGVGRLQLQGFYCELSNIPKVTLQSEEVIDSDWIDISFGLPEGTKLHVPKDQVLEILGLIQKSGLEDSGTDVAEDADFYPGINNLDGGLNKADDSNEKYSDLYQLQELVRGMDWELNHDMVNEQDAREAALVNIAGDPDYYKRKWWESEAREDLIDNNVGKDTLETEESPLANMGFNIDLGSGRNRQLGHIGFDLYPHDYGTYIHDLNIGIPLGDTSVRKVQMINALHHFELDDPKALFSEIQRVLMPGGQFVYQGPNEVMNQPPWTQDAPGMELTTKEDIGKVEGQPWSKQVFTRLASPDPATANDAEPRIGIAQYDMLPADALLAMDAVGYYYSDATSSGRGNRLHGYPSQGGLQQKGEHDPENISVLEEALDQFLEEEAREGVENGTNSAIDVDKGIDNACNEMARGWRLPNEMGDHALDIEESLQGPTSKSDSAIEKILKSQRVVPIIKANKMKQILYCVVLEPHTVDAQDDVMSPEDIEKTAHKYLENSRVIGGEHTKAINAVPVESFIAPQDFQVSGQYGDQVVKQGSWVLGVKVKDPEEWQKVLDGEYTGVSIGGFGQRSELTH
jgi:8-oxo-dGTP pyrophosphatase MutT (NUDIX family)